MNRLWIVTTVLVVSTTGCDEQIVQPVVVALKPPGAGGGAPCATAPATRTVPPPTCTGRCCPADMSCYKLGKPSPYSGAECLAVRDNTAAPRMQLRQTASYSIKPPGLAQSLVSNVLVHRSELPSPTCGAAMGLGGFIQLTDFDTVSNVSRTGFAKFATGLEQAALSGLCFVEDDAYSTPQALAGPLYAPPAPWPRGLPPPMPMPWKAVPVTATRLSQDFTLPADREKLLADFDVGGQYFGKFGGVFYYDPVKGYMHGYSPITYIVNYDSADKYIIIPIRESELTQWMNDPAHPNCAGSLLGDNAALPADCSGDATNRLWGCPAGNCVAADLAPTKVTGYFLIAELEQVTSLNQTLCSLFPGAPYKDWPIPDNMTCRSNPAFDPRDPVKGLPAGDWCAATNQPAQGDCHDAWQSVSYSTFQAFPVADGTCEAL